MSIMNNSHINKIFNIVKTTKIVTSSCNLIHRRLLTPHHKAYINAPIKRVSYSKNSTGYKTVRSWQRAHRTPDAKLHSVNSNSGTEQQINHQIARNTVQSNSLLTCMRHRKSKNAFLQQMQTCFFLTFSHTTIQNNNYQKKKNNPNQYFSTHDLKNAWLRLGITSEASLQSNNFKRSLEKLLQVKFHNLLFFPSGCIIVWQ